MSVQRPALTVLLLIALLTPGATASLDQPAASPTATKPPAASGSLLFVENAGQWPAAARFQVWNSPLGAGTIWLAQDAIWLVVTGGRSQVAGPAASVEPLVDLSSANLHYASLRDFVQPATSHALRLTFPGSNPDVRIEAFDPLTTTVSYFLGSDPAQWRPDVPAYGGVRYADMYPGVDLVLDGKDAFWRLEAKPGAENTSVRVQVEGAEILAIDGATVRLAAQGEPLEIVLPQAPFAYQAIGVSPQGGALALGVRSSLDPPREPAVPDDEPADLIYSTFLGGSRFDTGHAIAQDAAGRATITGTTRSSDFPTTPGAFDPGYNGGYYDAFVARLNTTGSALDYATFLGGSGDDFGTALALDAAGRVTVAGTTSSSDFPTTPGVFDPSYNGLDDSFVVRLNPAGNALDYATFVGGSAMDQGRALALDAAGRAVVAGYTESSDFPATPGAFHTSYNGGNGDAFVMRLNAGGSALDYATFLGGSDSDRSTSLALDMMGRATVTGSTTSSDFPITPGAFDTSYNGDYDAFVARLNTTGSTLDYATFLGGSDWDTDTAIALDTTGRAFVTGETDSSDFPTTPGAFDPDANGDFYDAFVVRLNPAGSALDYATFLGGSDHDGGHALALDAAGRATVTGRTRSVDFPTTPGAFDTSFNGGIYDGDAFVVRLNPTGSALDYATYLGGHAEDYGCALTLDTAGRATVMGCWTYSSNFPTTPGAFDPSISGIPDVFVSRLDLTPYTPNVIAPIEQPGAGAFVTDTVTLAGFAIDLASPTGAGIDAVHIYLDGPYGTGTIIGGATYGLDRPDIAAQYGERFRMSGWELAWNTGGVAPSVHRLTLYAHRTTDNAWSSMPPHPVLVRGDHLCWLPLVFKKQ